MSLSASELYEAAMKLPPSVRKDVALRLLESLEIAGTTIDEAWADEIGSRIDDILSGEVQAIPHDDVKAHLAQARADRQAARQRS